MEPPKFNIISGASLGEGNLYSLSCPDLTRPTQERRILLDAGVGGPQLAQALNSPTEVCFLSHAHLDHAIGVGEIANDLPVLMSKNTRIHLHQNGIESDNFQLFKFHKKYEYGDISVLPLPSGHIKGAAMFLLEAQRKRVLYTSDFCLHALEGVDAMSDLHEGIDLLVCESALSNFRVDENDIQSNEEKLQAFCQESGPSLIICRTIGDLAWIQRLSPQFIKHENCGGTLRHRDALDYLNTEAQIIVGGHLEKDSASERMVERLLSNPKAHIALINGVQRTKGGAKLIRFKRRSKVSWNAYQGRLRARIMGISLRNHPTRDEVISFIKTIRPKETLLVHGPDSGRYGITKALKKEGIHCRVPSSGQCFELK